jgi:hypothetical protein
MSQSDFPVQQPDYGNPAPPAGQYPPPSTTPSPYGPAATAPYPSGVDSAKPKKGPKIVLFIGIGLLVVATILGISGIVLTTRGVESLTGIDTITAGQTASVQLEADTEYGIAMLPYGEGNVAVFAQDGSEVTVTPYKEGNVELQGGTLVATFTTGAAGTYSLALTAVDPTTQFFIIPNPMSTIGETGGGIAMIVISGFVGFAGLVCLIIGLVLRSKQKKARVAQPSFAPAPGNPYGPAN